jgi:arsenate reductase
VITLYGISNCDTVRKARKWLDAHDVEYRFHDFRADGLAPVQVRAWLQELGADTLINRRSRTWRALDDAAKAAAEDAEAAIDLLVAEPTLIRRPVIDTGQEVQAGFTPADYAELLGRHTL